MPSSTINAADAAPTPPNTGISEKLRKTLKIAVPPIIHSFVFSIPTAVRKDATLDDTNLTGAVTARSIRNGIEAEYSSPKIKGIKGARSHTTIIAPTPIRSIRQFP
ncbi:hypothetical protein FQZ97_1112500 [compost metagenome]